MVETPDVNHLEKATATASNHEANTPFTAEKAIDGNPDTRWATDRDVVKPTIEFKLEKTTLIKHVEIDWDRRVRGEQMIQTSNLGISIMQVKTKSMEQVLENGSWLINGQELRF